MASEWYDRAYDLDGLIYVADVPCSFDLSYDEDAVTGCNLEYAVLGEYVAGRRVLMRMFGDDAIARVEDAARDHYLEDFKP